MRTLNQAQTKPIQKSWRRFIGVFQEDLVAGAGFEPATFRL